MCTQSTQRIIAICGAISVFCLSGCSSLNHTENGALIGSGVGATTGAIIGHQTGNRDAGALIGAAAGAVGGAVIGHDRQVREEQSAAFAAAQHAEMQRQAAAQAVTNQDIVRMTQSGLSNRVIVNAVHTRGGRFDMSPDALIAMKSAGVDDQVIQAMQQGAAPHTTTTAIPPSTTTVVEAPAPPSVVFVAPRPSAQIVIGPRRGGRHWRPRRWRRCW